MTLYELLELTNDSTTIEIFQSSTAERLGTYDGKSEVPEWWHDDEVTDVFTGMNGNTPTLCIEIDVEPDFDYIETENHSTPCDYADENGEFHCPYDAQGSDACRCYCGLGVDD